MSRPVDVPQCAALPLALGTEGGLAWPLYDA